MRIYIAAGIVSLLFAVSASSQSRPSGSAASKQGSQNQPGLTSASGESPAGIERGKIDPAKEADIRRLMDVIGAKALIGQVMDGMVNNLKPLMVNSLPPGDYRDNLVELFFEKFRSRVDTQQLVDLAVPGYDKYLSDEEIRGLIAFYQTPLGQKALEVLPKLSVELQTQGQKWGESLGRQCMLEVLSEHPDLAKALSDAGKAARPQ